MITRYNTFHRDDVSLLNAYLLFAKGGSSRNKNNNKKNKVGFTPTNYYIYKNNIF